MVDRCCENCRFFEPISRYYFRKERYGYCNSKTKAQVFDKYSHRPPFRDNRLDVDDSFYMNKLMDCETILNNENYDPYELEDEVEDIMVYFNANYEQCDIVNECEQTAFFRKHVATNIS